MWLREGNEGQPTVETLFCTFRTSTVGADALPGPSLSVSLSLVTHGGSPATRLQGRPRHTERL